MLQRGGGQRDSSQRAVLNVSELQRGGGQRGGRLNSLMLDYPPRWSVSAEPSLSPGDPCPVKTRSRVWGRGRADRRSDVNDETNGY